MPCNVKMTTWAHPFDRELGSIMLDPSCEPVIFVPTPIVQDFFFPFVLSATTIQLLLIPLLSSALITASFCGP